MKRILMIGTGGTIACKLGTQGLSPVITTEELLSYVPGCAEFCTVNRDILWKDR